MNRELTLREKVLLLILIVLVMVLGYFKLLYEPVSDRIARCREDTAQEQLALEQNAVRLAQMEKMEQALADIRAAGGSKAIPRFNNSEALLREHADLLTGLAEYLLIHETIEGDDFRYYCEHGVMPVHPDDTIEPPAKVIRRMDEAPETPQPEAEAPAQPEAPSAPDADAPNSDPGEQP